MNNDARIMQAAELIRQAWPGLLGQRVVEVVMEDDAAGALAYRLNEAKEEEADPVVLLRSVDKADLAWAIEEADNPAAYLARRVMDAR